jgi:hypothetical protein
MRIQQTGQKKKRASLFSLDGTFKILDLIKNKKDLVFWGAFRA